jgi:NADH-quinone oxidoreductase subunit J
LSLIIFFILAIVAIGAAVMVITTKSPVSSALFLVMVMCSLAGLFVLMGALFLAAMQVIVYAGAIMVLFLFVIMLLNMRKDELGKDPHRIQKHLGYSLVAILLIQGIVIVNWAMKDYKSGLKAIAESGVADTTSTAGYSGAHEVAMTLFTKYSYPFEVTSILLLAAIIGAVVIARKKLPEESEEE